MSNNNGKLVKDIRCRTRKIGHSTVYRRLSDGTY